jgi:urease beta subunit
MADAEAAEETARALVALPSEWTVLHHVRWPGRSGAAVDHVVVGPGGVFVIGSSPARKAAATACATAADVLAVGASLDREMVHAVLCHSGDQPEVNVRDVAVCSPEEIVPLLLSLERVLEPDELGSAQAFVASVMKPAAAASSRRDRSAGSMGRLGLILLITAAAVSALPWAAAKVEDARAGKPPPTPTIGEVVWVAGTTTRPPLELTAEELDGGGRRYVVQLTVRNDGDRPFDMGSLGTGLELDNLQQAEPVTRTEVELAGVRLEPGKERIVTYRFTVSSDRSAAFFAATVGDKRADRARWRIE